MSCNTKCLSKIVKKENLYGANSFDRLPVALAKAEGAYVWDSENRRYTDFICSSSALNQGHCHPRIVKELVEQASTLTLTSNLFHNENYSEYAEYITALFGYDRVLPLNTGCEATDIACKLARKWGYLKKNIPDNKAKIVFAEGYYMGRTMVGISASTNETCRRYCGPFMPGFVTVPFDDLEALEKLFKSDPYICAFMLEPILGNGGIVVPKPGYHKNVRSLCTKYNVLWVDDEIQAGLGRTGKLLAVNHENARPDIVCLGKSLSGGIVPVSAILADDDVMLCMQPGEHGSTFGGNPLSSRVALAALKVIVDENLCEKALLYEELLRKEFQRIKKEVIVEIRGQGLFLAIVIKEGLNFNAKDICQKLLTCGIMTTTLKCNIVRIVPPLVIEKEELLRCANIIVDIINLLHN